MTEWQGEFLTFTSALLGAWTSSLAGICTRICARLTASIYAALSSSTTLLGVGASPKASSTHNLKLTWHP